MVADIDLMTVSNDWKDREMTNRRWEDSPTGRNNKSLDLLFI